MLGDLRREVIEIFGSTSCIGDKVEEIWALLETGDDGVVYDAACPGVKETGKGGVIGLEAIDRGRGDFLEKG